MFKYSVFVFVIFRSFSSVCLCDSDKLNKESVRLIETGLFSLCLDSPVMRISDEKYAHTHTHTHPLSDTQVFLCLLNVLSNLL